MSRGSESLSASPLPAALVAQARLRPNSWVYELAPGVEASGSVSPAQIRRAWRTDAEGRIVASECVDNAYYAPSVAAARVRPRRGMVIAAILVALVRAVLVVLVLLDAGHSPAGATTRAQAASAVTRAGGPEAPAGALSPAAAPAAGAVTRTQIRRAQARPATVPAPPPRPVIHARHAPRPLAQLSLRAAIPVWVCLQDAQGRLLINGQTLTPAQMQRPLRGSGFRLFAGNGKFSIVIDGVAHPASGSSDPVAYVVRGSRVSQLPGYPAEPCP
jgi:hypothetical protein